MKKIFFIIGMIVLSFNLYSQDDTSENNGEIKTLFGQAKSHGGYGAPIYRYGIINKNGAYINGGRGAWIINHSFALGGGGVSFASEIMHDQAAGVNYQLNGGYGGILLEPILLYKFPLHIAIPVLIGAGGSSYIVKDYMNEDYIEDTKPFFVAEPGVELEINVLKFFRLNFGAYYRYTYGGRLRYSDGEVINAVRPDALNDLSFGITLKFGKF
jgi:hypothetical protein